MIRLRAWGSERVYALHLDERNHAIGTAPACAIRVYDDANFVSREHCHLEWDGRHWCIVDRSKNGLYLDGEPHGKSLLLPGMRIGLGPRVTLIAESVRTIALRAALARMMGWSAELADTLDVAFQNLRSAATGKSIFMICGEGDLLGFAQELHQLAIGEQRPIVFCSTGGRRRQSTDQEADVMRAIKRVSSGREAIRLAHGGTICVDNRRLPKDLIRMLELLRDVPSPIQTLVIVLSKYVRKTEVFTPTPFVIPRLSARRAELERLFVEYESISADKLNIGPLTLTAAQRRWVRERCETLSDFQTSILRLIALRHAGTTCGAADLLGISSSGLRQWLAARELATD